MVTCWESNSPKKWNFIWWEFVWMVTQEESTLFTDWSCSLNTSSCVVCLGMIKPICKNRFIMWVFFFLRMWPNWKMCSTLKNCLKLWRVMGVWVFELVEIWLIWFLLLSKGFPSMFLGLKLYKRVNTPNQVLREKNK